MVLDFTCEKTISGRVALTAEECIANKQLPKEQQLHVTDAHCIIHPGKGHDAWWDMKQLNKQKEDTMLNIFEYLFPDCVAVTVFDCSSAHEALTQYALTAVSIK